MQRCHSEGAAGYCVAWDQYEAATEESVSLLRIDQVTDSSGPPSLLTCFMAQSKAVHSESQHTKPCR